MTLFSLIYLLLLISPFFYYLRFCCFCFFTVSLLFFFCIPFYVISKKKNSCLQYFQFHRRDKQTLRMLQPNQLNHPAKLFAYSSQQIYEFHFRQHIYQLRLQIHSLPSVDMLTCVCVCVYTARIPLCVVAIIVASALSSSSALSTSLFITLLCLFFRRHSCQACQLDAVSFLYIHIQSHIHTYSHT